jgi:hypothetical protein
VRRLALPGLFAPSHLLPNRHNSTPTGTVRSSAGKVCSAEFEAGWLQFFRGLSALACAGSLVSSDAHTGLVAALGATLPGAAWQRWVPATPRSSYPVPSASMFFETTSSVFCSSAVGLNSTTSVPAYSVGRCPGGA